MSATTPSFCCSEVRRQCVDTLCKEWNVWKRVLLKEFFILTRCYGWGLLTLISLLMFLIYFLNMIFFFFFRLLVCKTFLVMTMFLLHVDLKNSVMPKMTLSWITVVRHSLTIFVTLKWRIRIVTCCEWSGLGCWRWHWEDSLWVNEVFT